MFQKQCCDFFLPKRNNSAEGNCEHRVMQGFLQKLSSLKIIGQGEIFAYACKLCWLLSAYPSRSFFLPPALWLGRVNYPESFDLWFPLGFRQWQVLSRNQKVGGKKGQLTYFHRHPLPNQSELLTRSLFPQLQLLLFLSPFQG